MSLTSINIVPKLKIQNPLYWKHHRNGWRFIVDVLEDHFHSEDGIEFVSSIEDVVSTGKILTESWVGFLHQVPVHDIPHFPDLHRLIQLTAWKKSLPSCQGIFVMTSYQKKWLLNNKISVPIARIPYVTDTSSNGFCMDRFRANQSKKIVSMGGYLRNFSLMEDLKALDYQKIILNPDNLDTLALKASKRVQIWDRVDDKEYDELLAQNIVFLNLKDAAANTVVVECMASMTPLLINKVGGIEEYLGPNYPFYYKDLKEAEAKVNSIECINETHDYLGQPQIVKKVQKDHFIQEFGKTAIYQSLPMPKNKISSPPKKDVSLMINSYKRVYNLDGLLDRLSRQDFDGSFEVLIWNNNFETQSELNALHKKYNKRLNIKLFHSSENYYCVSRLALCGLIESDMILICDDDVLPEPNYISFLLRKQREYGENAVVCCGGHRFNFHCLDEENPHLAWEFYKPVFYDVHDDDCIVHIMHANSCVIPKQLLLKALCFEYEKYEFVLVDDYWLSYVLSSKLGATIHKVKASHVTGFTECCDDKQIAMFHNKKVMDQRISFYIHHMRNNWPFSS